MFRACVLNFDFLVAGICAAETKDCFNAQTDFLFEVKGTAGSFVLWGGDRWSQRTKKGIGKNIWLPLQWKAEEPQLKWFSNWNVDSSAGTWKKTQKLEVFDDLAHWS